MSRTDANMRGAETTKKRSAPAAADSFKTDRPDSLHNRLQQTANSGSSGCIGPLPLRPRGAGALLGLAWLGASTYVSHNARVSASFLRGNLGKFCGNIIKTWTTAFPAHPANPPRGCRTFWRNAGEFCFHFMHIPDSSPLIASYSRRASVRQERSPRSNRWRNGTTSSRSFHRDLKCPEWSG